MKRFLKKSAWLIPVLLIFELSVSTAFCKVKVYYEKREGIGYDFYADNTHPVECWVKVDFKNASNLKFSKNLPFKGVIPGNSGKKMLFKARPVRKDKGYGFRFSYIYVTGDPSKKTDRDAVYYFPFLHGTKHKITQGYKGGKTHYGENEYALDFEMKEGTKVVASRDGIVVEIKEDSNIGGTSEKYNKYGNYILIYHSDGTFSNYVHLKQNGALVNKGQRVRAGQVIGLSGNTGRSSGPHLHFSVSKPDFEGKRVTIPVRFLSPGGNSVDPLAGEYFFSTHYGKGAYKIFLGKNLTNDHYRNYRRRVGKDGRVDLRSKRVDDTILIFFRNGTSNRLSIVVDFKLGNLKPSRPVPLSKEVGPQTEVYICFLRPVDPLEGFSFSTSSRYRILD